MRSSECGSSPVVVAFTAFTIAASIIFKAHQRG
jgi:hypothetical protein